MATTWVAKNTARVAKIVVRENMLDEKKVKIIVEVKMQSDAKGDGKGPATGRV